MPESQTEGESITVVTHTVNPWEGVQAKPPIRDAFAKSGEKPNYEPIRARMAEINDLLGEYESQLPETRSIFEGEKVYLLEVETGDKEHPTAEVGFTRFPDGTSATNIIWESGIRFLPGPGPRIQVQPGLVGGVRYDVYPPQEDRPTTGVKYLCEGVDEYGWVGTSGLSIDDPHTPPLSVDKIKQIENILAKVQSSLHQRFSGTTG